VCIALNDYLFKGRYHGFNKNNPTSDSGGKTKVVQRLKDKYGFKRYGELWAGLTDSLSGSNICCVCTFDLN
jgi:hypothetical protein